MVFWKDREQQDVIFLHRSNFNWDCKSRAEYWWIRVYNVWFKTHSGNQWGFEYTNSKTLLEHYKGPSRKLGGFFFFKNKDKFHILKRLFLKSPRQDERRKWLWKKQSSRGIDNHSSYYPLEIWAEDDFYQWFPNITLLSFHYVVNLIWM